MKNLSLGGLLVLALVSCEAERSADIHSENAPYGVLEAALEGHCEIHVVGTGIIDMETDYLPHVVNCENGAAPMEALKAQAVAARSYAYYSIGLSGSIGDSQKNQVYSCGKTPGPQHYEAVNATLGEVVSFEGIQVAAFYVAGKAPSSPDCVALPSDIEPGGENTEPYVTYNWGKSGVDVEQSTLGSLDNYTQNRGCKSQNGATCLANQGWDYTDILHFYYGADILISSPPTPCQSTTCPPFEQNQCAVQGKSCVLVGGSPTCKEICVPHCEGALLIDENCEVEGDCSVFGATCAVNEMGAPECVSSPPQCEHQCDGDTIIYNDCTVGDCSAFGATCVEEEGIVQCGPVTCEKKCISDTEFQNTDCTMGDCGLFGAYCSEVLGDGPDCVSVFCAESPTAEPESKKLCWEGKAYFCTLNGLLEEIPLVAEQCDGFDNDCNGEVDEGVKNACGQCGPVPEEVCDGSDNDCDGDVDEGCPEEGGERAGEGGTEEETGGDEGVVEGGTEEETGGDEGVVEEGTEEETGGDESVVEDGTEEETGGDESVVEEGSEEETGEGESVVEERTGGDGMGAEASNRSETAVGESNGWLGDLSPAESESNESEVVSSSSTESGCRHSSSSAGWFWVMVVLGISAFRRYTAFSV